MCEKHNVVFRTITGKPTGLVTWSSFKNKACFDEWYDEKMQGWYEVVDQGISEERALELCSSPGAKITAITYQLGKITDYLKA